MMINLRSEKALIIEINEVENYARVPRIHEESCFMAPVGQKTKERDALESERRLYGDEGLP